MEDIQLQTIAHVVGDQLHIQITSGVDILLETHYRLKGEDPPLDFVEDQLKGSFEYALEVKLDLVQRKGKHTA